MYAHATGIPTPMYSGWYRSQHLFVMDRDLRPLFHFFSLLGGHAALEEIVLALAGNASVFEHDVAQFLGEAIVSVYRMTRAAQRALLALRQARLQANAAQRLAAARD